VADFMMDLFHQGQPGWLYAVVLPLVAALAALLVYVVVYPMRSSMKRTIFQMHRYKTVARVLPSAEFHRIAITVDFSPFDQKTLSQAVAIGRKDARYCLIHVVESAAANVFGKDSIDGETQEDRNRLVDYAAQLLQQGYHVDIELGFGKPTRVIPQLVEKFNADLLVMGEHGHRGLKDIIFGETIATVRHRIRIPLLSVK